LRWVAGLGIVAADPMATPNFYAGLVLDRMAERRRDDEFILGLLAVPTTCIVPVWRGFNLIGTDSEPRAVFVTAGQWRPGGEVTFLGMAGTTAYFATDLSSLDQREAEARLAGIGQFVDLRSVGPVIDRQSGALLAYARGLAHWHARHRFCGACGAPTVSRAAGHVRACANPACAIEHFPRTDPAVIMLVTHHDQCFLARNRRFPGGMHSTLAGFVEPGESLEDAVAREVREEAGIAVGDVTYRSSQPWPFPASIMLGFRAEATATAFALDADELESGAWFTRAELRAPRQADSFRLPRPDSIARRLIEDWVAEG
jgi:NAD+ diphosphatase